MRKLKILLLTFTTLVAVDSFAAGAGWYEAQKRIQVVAALEQAHAIEIQNVRAAATGIPVDDVAAGRAALVNLLPTPVPLPAVDATAGGRVPLSVAALPPADVFTDLTASAGTMQADIAGAIAALNDIPTVAGAADGTATTSANSAIGYIRTVSNSLGAAIAAFPVCLPLILPVFINPS